MVLQVREMTAEEEAAITRLAKARTEPARLVERATIIHLAQQGQRVPAIARDLGLGEDTVRLWLKRFNATGIEGLAVYLQEQKGIGIKRSRIGEILLAEGLRWWQQESWFGERVDPRFAEQRGPSSPSTPSHQKEA